LLYFNEDADTTKQNFWLFQSTMERDPSGLLAWMAKELEAAETAGERVWIIGMISKTVLGIPSHLPDFQDTCL